MNAKDWFPQEAEVTKKKAFRMQSKDLFVASLIFYCKTLCLICLMLKVFLPVCIYMCVCVSISVYKIPATSTV